MLNLLRYLLLIGLLLKISSLRADHLIGGEMGMTYLDKPGHYRVTMKQHWNEAINTVRYETQQEVYVFSRRTNTFIDFVRLVQTKKQAITYQNPACAKANRLQNAEVTYEGDFQFDVTRYTDPGGYYIIWERCCRNGDLQNLAEPDETGIILYMQFPAMQTNGQEFTNSSPEFAAAPSEYACLNQPFQADFGGKDKDGDQLTYRLVTPWAGQTTSAQTQRQRGALPTNPPARWQAGFGDNNVIPGAPPLQIDPNTGLISVNANRTGLFSFAIEVTERRNGQVVGLVRREFYLLVVDCAKSLLEPPVITRNNQPVETATLCPNDSIRLSVPSSGTATYQWRRDGVDLPNATAATLTTRQPGVYTVLKKATGTCTRDTLSKPVQVDRSDVEASFDSIPPVCAPTAGAILLKATPVGGQFDGRGITGNTFSPQTAGVGRHLIKYTLTDPGGCRVEEQRIAEVRQPIELNIPRNYSIAKGDTVTLAASANIAPASVEWLPPVDLNNPRLLRPLANPQQTQTYELRVTTPEGCTATAQVTVIILGQIAIPTAFTPNQDGLNDTWDLMGLSAYPSCEVTVFNRWGLVIFKSVGYGQPWDGTSNGVPVEPGAYAYQIRLGTGQNLYRGSLTVLR